MPLTRESASWEPRQGPRVPLYELGIVRSPRCILRHVTLVMAPSRLAASNITGARFPLVSVAWVLRWEVSSLPRFPYSTRTMRDWSFKNTLIPNTLPLLPLLDLA